MVLVQAIEERLTEERQFAGLLLSRSTAAVHSIGLKAGHVARI